MIALLLAAACGSDCEPRTGLPTLQVWLDLAEPTGTRLQSRSQAVFVRSMARQHDLTVRIHDTSGSPRATTLAADLGLPADWLVTPAPGAPAPVVWLRGTDGCVRHRWDGFASSAQLDTALRHLKATRPATSPPEPKGNVVERGGASKDLSPERGLPARQAGPHLR